jgi:carboxyl-terminal processing protease
MTYVKQNKWKFLATVVFVGGLFFAFKSFNNNPAETLELRHRKLLTTIGHLLESEHYNPRKIDDSFSGEVFDAYLKALDPEKNMFIQADLDSLTKFKKSIDDEIHGAKIEFEPAVSKMYDRRYQEVKQIFESIIKTPFNYNIDDSIKLDADSINYAANLDERYTRWYKIIKYKC